MDNVTASDYKDLKLKLSGYTKPGQELFRNIGALVEVIRVRKNLLRLLKTDSTLRIRS